MQLNDSPSAFIRKLAMSGTPLKPENIPGYEDFMMHNVSLPDRITNVNPKSSFNPSANIARQPDYDFPGYYQYSTEAKAGNGHFTDQYKMPNHPTFSNESVYAALRPDIAGQWDYNLYIPSLIAAMKGKQPQFEGFPKDGQ